MVLAVLAAVATTGCGSSVEDDLRPAVASAAALDVPDLSGGYTMRIELAGAFRAALESAGARPSARGTASLRGGTATFPITSGALRARSRGEDEPPQLSGRIDHDGGGLELAGAAGRLALEDLQLDLPAGVVVAKVVRGGRTTAGSLPLLSFDLATTAPLRLSPSDSGAAIDGTAVRLRPEGAELLRRVFGFGTPRAGDRVGTAKLTIDRDGPD